ncbi:hypothetical protein SAMN05421578_12112 [Paenibacillus macquariensis]|uniref:Uncharacterized protein n=1 Tax=Paenibacillus macquariensis TaxID=948756 RepID=A0ABY1KEL6_9BACL|nr:hypothetical protein SAMN05421578_12112 [Paenibacillus macquariensis]
MVVTGPSEMPMVYARMNKKMDKITLSVDLVEDQLFLLVLRGDRYRL